MDEMALAAEQPGGLDGVLPPTGAARRPTGPRTVRHRTVMSEELPIIPTKIDGDPNGDLSFLAAVDEMFDLDESLLLRGMVQAYYESFPSSGIESDKKLLTMLELLRRDKASEHEDSDVEDVLLSLAYCCLGCFSETASDSEQAHRAMDTCMRLLRLGAFDVLFRPLLHIVDDMEERPEQAQQCFSRFVEAQCEGLGGLRIKIMAIILAAYERAGPENGVSLDVPNVVTCLIKLVAACSLTTSASQEFEEFLPLIFLLLQRSLAAVNSHAPCGSAEDPAQGVNNNIQDLTAGMQDLEDFEESIRQKYPGFRLNPDPRTHSAPRNMDDFADAFAASHIGPINSFEASGGDFNYSTTPIPSPPSSALLRPKRPPAPEDSGFPFRLPLSQADEGLNDGLPKSVKEALELFKQKTAVPHRDESDYRYEQALLEQFPGLRYEKSAGIASLGENSELITRNLSTDSGMEAHTVYTRVMKDLWRFVEVSLKYMSKLYHQGAEENLRQQGANLPRTSAGNSRTSAGLRVPTRSESVAYATSIHLKLLSETLLILLEWFGSSHVLKYETMCLYLLDSGVLVLFNDILGSANSICEPVGGGDGTSKRRLSHLMSQFWSHASSEHNEPSANTEGPRDGYSHTELDTSSSSSSENSALSARSGSDFGTNTTETLSATNVRTILCMLRITLHIVRKKPQRLVLLIQLKGLLLLKRCLRVPCQQVELASLELYKGMVPLCGRKWRQNNMRIITSIYLHCKPLLQDDWAHGLDCDVNIELAAAQETELRQLCSVYNTRLRILGTDQASASGPFHSKEDNDDDDDDDDFFENELRLYQQHQHNNAGPRMFQ